MNRCTASENRLLLLSATTRQREQAVRTTTLTETTMRFLSLRFRLVSLRFRLLLCLHYLPFLPGAI